MKALRQRSKIYADMLQRDTIVSHEQGAELNVAVAATPNDQITAAVNLLREQLKDGLREQIATAGFQRFERLIRDLLVAMEYGEDLDAGKPRTGGSDGGVDGVISQDKFGLDRIYLQAKLYSDVKVGRPAVQGFVGSLIGHGAPRACL